MTTITVRIYDMLNDKLDKISLNSGIPKSSLILFGLNICLRNPSYKFQGLNYISLDNVDISNDTNKSVRFTLKLPDEIKQALKEISKSNNISINSMINESVRHFCVVIGSDFLKQISTKQ